MPIPTLSREEIRRRFEALPDSDEPTRSPAIERSREYVGSGDDQETVIVCRGRWPITCVDAWPVSRFAWCNECRERHPSKKRGA